LATKFDITLTITHHRGPKQKLLLTGYRAPSLKRTSNLCISL